MNTRVPTKVAANILGLHEETLRNWNRRGLNGLPKPSRMGSRLRWDVAELNAWAEAQKA